MPNSIPQYPYDPQRLGGGNPVLIGPLYQPVFFFPRPPTVNGSR